MGDGFYRSKDPTNSIKEKTTKENTGNGNNKIHLYIHNNRKKDTNITTSPLVYTMG